MLRISIFAASIFLMTIVYSSCDSEDPISLSPQQNVTILAYTLTPVNGGPSIVLTYEDEDGNGGSDGIVIGGTLTKSMEYLGELEIQAIVDDTVVDITESIRQDGIQNQFFYTNTNPALTMSYDDEDANGFPIGIASKLTTVNNTGEGILKVSLRHNPDKSGIGVSGGNVSLAGGRNDLEVDFPVLVE